MWNLEISQGLLALCEYEGQEVQSQIVIGAGIDFKRGGYLLAATGIGYELRLYLYEETKEWEKVTSATIPPSKPVWR